MNISPLEIYFVLQLDNVKDMLEGAAFLTGIGAVVYTVMSTIFNNIDGDESLKPLKPRYWAFAIVMMTAYALMPSSKTAAAMIILPPLVNEGLPAVGDEARELYNLAKQALENAVDAPATPPQDPQP